LSLAEGAQPGTGGSSSSSLPALLKALVEGARAKASSLGRRQEEEGQSQPEAERKRQRKEKEEERRKAKEEEERAKEEEQRQKEKEKEEKEEQEREARRRQKELEDKEEEAVQRARHKARRPLNAFEERRVRRQVRSELTGGGLTSEASQQQRDWFRPLRPEVKSQLDDAIKFFSDTMRVPATLLGSAALGMLFLPPFKWGFLKEEQQAPRFVAVWRLYVLLTAFTFCAELTVVLGTSNAHAQLLELGRSGLPLEPTAMDLIMGHMEFEYLTCSLNFFGGVVTFMLATFCRVIAVFLFANSRRMPQEPQLCMAIGGMMLSSLLWWLHLANVRILEFQNIGNMMSRYMQLLVARMRLGEVGVVGSAALLLSLATFLAATRLVLAPLLWCPRGKQ